MCPPPESGITAYDTTRQTLERRITEFNHAWSTSNWQPIDYLPRNLPFIEVIDHYLAADVFWVNSLQDGMNLTAKEFIAAQAAAGLSGVLVLSHRTGAADQLGTAALLTDPRSPASLVDTLQQALTLGPAERRTRLKHRSWMIDVRAPPGSRVVTPMPNGCSSLATDSANAATSEPS